MTSRQHTRQQALKAAGWKRQDVWLSPDDQIRLTALCAHLGVTTQVAIRKAIDRALAWEASGQAKRKLISSDQQGDDR